jgi:hypothetical protein
LDLSPWLSKVKLGDGAIVPHVIEIIDLKDRY